MAFAEMSRAFIIFNKVKVHRYYPCSMDLIVFWEQLVYSVMEKNGFIISLILHFSVFFSSPKLHSSTLPTIKVKWSKKFNVFSEKWFK